LKTILLWDIDGTLITTNGIGAPVLENSTSKYIGKPVKINRFFVSGMTDFEIVNFLSKEHNIMLSTAEVEFIVNEYANNLVDIYNANPPVVNKNIEKILTRVSESRVLVNSIASGNCEIGGKIKLESCNLLRFFQNQENFFATSSNPTRLQIIGKAKKFSETYEHALVIGDSPRDIYCAQQNNLPVLAIDYGMHSKSDLASSNPTHILYDDWSVQDFFNILANYN